MKQNGAKHEPYHKPGKSNYRDSQQNQDMR